MTPVRFTGALRDLGDTDLRRRIAAEGSDRALDRDTARIIDDVRANGDRALRTQARTFDGVSLDSLEVSRPALRRALDGTPAALRRALERAAANIASVHSAFAPVASETSPERGILIGRRPDPLDRVGVYAPGGRAAYPSSVLMGAVPVRIAGVREVILASPPSRNGQPADVILAAAAIAGVDRVFAIGGAGAIAAMAFGTETVPRVDRVVGPGNAYVASAKRQLATIVGIDSPAGPSELLVIADDGADPTRVAVEMLAQAEHDPNAIVVAITLSRAMADTVLAALAERIIPQPRADVMQRALATRGGVLVAASLDEAIAFSNAFAPEHLLLAVADPERALERVRNAGSVFLGETTSVVFGDYVTGANHVLPTGGAARWYSGLSPLDFVRWTTWQRVDADAATSLSGDASVLARSEGLMAHASAALYQPRAVEV